ncbi:MULTISPECIES: hypothetical protein [unclassified Ensifer]|uniref:hypothetical protein n=1 Tax=unclassified Ensifer TaxID=2633371 RepID=UPI000812F93A|nr:MULTISPECIES: hypothetical protein [unclassified Ensifer]OCP07164.1 hypothetical protein BBX50_22615 [Ensifer sp. LC11]OCP07746.1 hypothetical protein BC374_22830 [Ensifer sp. LC13]OCP12092.1 hypothetical protein BC362_06450 [Ensifer sp. LC14]OCP31802.1 hypothetical protein BC364_21870 [Ensifer sp. LC499]
MLKFLSILTSYRASDDRMHDAPLAWARDPLQHPDLERMDERELGDLPFPGWPWPRASECAGDCLQAGGR